MITLYDNSNIKIISNGLAGTAYNIYTSDSIDEVVSNNKALEIQHGDGESLVVVLKKSNSFREWQKADRIFVGGWVKDVVGAGLFVRWEVEDFSIGNAYQLIRKSDGWYLTRGLLGLDAEELQEITPVLAATDGFLNLGLSIQQDNYTDNALIIPYETNKATPTKPRDYRKIPGDQKYLDPDYLSGTVGGHGLVSASALGNISHYFDRFIFSQDF